MAHNPSPNPQTAAGTSAGRPCPPPCQIAAHSRPLSVGKPAAPWSRQCLTPCSAEASGRTLAGLSSGSDSLLPWWRCWPPRQAGLRQTQPAGRKNVATPLGRQHGYVLCVHVTPSNTLLSTLTAFSKCLAALDLRGASAASPPNLSARSRPRIPVTKPHTISQKHTLASGSGSAPWPRLRPAAASSCGCECEELLLAASASAPPIGSSCCCGGTKLHLRLLTSLWASFHTRGHSTGGAGGGGGGGSGRI